MLTDDEIDRIMDAQWGKGLQPNQYQAHRAASRAIEAATLASSSAAREDAERLLFPTEIVAWATTLRDYLQDTVDDNSPLVGDWRGDVNYAIRVLDAACQDAARSATKGDKAA